MSPCVDFLILGPLDVRSDAGRVTVTGERPRALLALLLLHANEPVSGERVAQALWGDDAAADAIANVRVVVSRLRRALPDADLLTTTPAGYLLRVAPGELDSERFAVLVEDGRRLLAAGDAARAGLVLRDALALWRGSPLADVALESFAQVPIARLEEERLAALELRIDADLTAGEGASLIPELQQLADQHPLRERVHAQLMLALYRAGRQTEALELYRRLRTAFVDERGIEPGRELRELEAGILRHDPGLEAPADDGALDRGREPPAAAPRRAAGARARLSMLGRRFWLLTVATAAVAATGMFFLRDQVFQSERGSAAALSDSAYRGEIGRICSNVTRAERAWERDAGRLRRSLREARTTREQRDAIMATTRTMLARSGRNLADLLTLEPPEAKRAVHSRTAQLWNYALDQSRAYSLRLDRTSTRKELLGAIAPLSEVRPELDRNLVTQTAGLQRLGGRDCRIRRIADVPIPLPTLPRDERRGTEPEARARRPDVKPPRYHVPPAAPDDDLGTRPGAPDAAPPVGLPEPTAPPRAGGESDGAERESPDDPTPDTAPPGGGGGGSGEG